MLSIDGVSLAPAARAWLARSPRARILHVFDRACNLINEGREVLSLVTPQIGNGPFNLVLEDEVLFPDYLDAHSQITIRAHQLDLGDLAISTADSKLWPARPDWETLHAMRDGFLDQLISLPITNYEPLLPHSLISNLSSALASADISSALTITSQLAGLGMGLTPAGDDFILGGLLAAWILHPAELAGTLAAGMANTAAPLTTSLSAAWLRAAGKGEAGVLWHELFQALISADPGNVRASAGKILAVGKTSGADALAGFLGAWSRWAESAALRI